MRNTYAVKSIDPAIVNLRAALKSGGIVSIEILIARKLEPFIIHSATSINQTLDCCFTRDSLIDYYRRLKLFGIMFASAYVAK